MGVMLPPLLPLSLPRGCLVPRPRQRQRDATKKLDGSLPTARKGGARAESQQAGRQAATMRSVRLSFAAELLGHPRWPCAAPPGPAAKTLQAKSQGVSGTQSNRPRAGSDLYAVLLFDDDPRNGRGGASAAFPRPVYEREGRRCGGSALLSL